MIRIDQAPCPPIFYREVTVPGEQALKRSAKGGVLLDLWNKHRGLVFRAYHGICAYLAVQLVEAVGFEIDHFKPKLRHRDLAYRWDNLRLSSSAMNRRKGGQTIADPFTLPISAFRINFLTGRIRIDPALDSAMRTCLAETIHRLDLNSAEARKTRTDAYVGYKKERGLDVEDLTRRYPFAAFEMMRQGRLREGDAKRCSGMLKSLGYASCVEGLDRTRKGEV